MRLHSAASYFDTEPCLDAYSGYPVFRGQFDLYDDSRRSGVGIERRVLSTAASSVIPQRRVVTSAGANWLVGDYQPDTFRGSIIRHKYVIQMAGGLARVHTGQSLISGAAGIGAYGSVVFYKDWRDDRVTSVPRIFYYAFFAKGEPVDVDSLLAYQGTTYLVIATYPDAAGFLACEAVALSKPVTTIQYHFKAATYDLVSGGYAGGTTQSIPALPLEFKDDFVYPTEGVEQFKVGDYRFRVRVADVPSPSPNDQVDALGRQWRVVSALRKPDATWLLHMRPT